MPGAFRSKTNGEDRSAVNRPVQERPEEGDDHDQDGQLHRDAAGEVALAQAKEVFGKAREVVHTPRQSLGQPAEQGERAERHDQRRNAEPRDEPPVQAASGRPYPKRSRDRDADGQTAVAVHFSQQHRGEAHKRADGQVDAAADDHRRQRHREQAQLDAQARHLRRVVEGEEVRADQPERQDFEDENEKQNTPLTGERANRGNGQRAGRGGGHLILPSVPGHRSRPRGG
jgi:hypothetical protein